jgi:hypothetical protein
VAAADGGSAVPAAGEVLEEIGARQDACRAPVVGDDDRWMAVVAGEVGEDGVHGLTDLDRGERRVHGRRHLVLERALVSEHTLEEAPLADRPDHVGKRLDRLVPDDRDL